MLKQTEIAALQALGLLSESELRCYLALLNTGPCSVRQAARAARISHTATSKVVERLKSLGLAQYLQRGKRKKYYAENPEALVSLLEEKRSQLREAEEAAKTLIPRLGVLMSTRVGEAQIRNYEEDEGIRLILRDVIKTVRKLPRKEYYVYSSWRLRDSLYRKFKDYTLQRVKEGISVKVIAIGKGGKLAKLAERRWLEEPARTRLSSYTIIYGDKLAQIFSSSNDKLYGVVVEEPAVAATQRLLFERLWGSLEKSE